MKYDAFLRSQIQIQKNDKNTSNVSLEIQVLISKQLKMPDWEQLTTVGVDQAWRVVRKEVVLSIIHTYDKTSIIVCVNIFSTGGEGAVSWTSACSTFASS